MYHRTCRPPARKGASKLCPLLQLQIVREEFEEVGVQNAADAPKKASVNVFLEENLVNIRPAASQL